MMSSASLQLLPQLNYGLLLSWQSWALVAVVVVILVVSIWRRLGPGFPGIVRGVHTIVPIYEGKYFEEVTGNLVEFTDYLLAPEFQQGFADYVRRNAPMVARFAEQTGAAVQDPAAVTRMLQGQEFITRFGDLRLAVNGVRTVTSKHVFLTFYDASKVFPNDYVQIKEHASVSWTSLDWSNRGLIMGFDQLLPQRWVIPGIGSIHVHIFFPVPMAAMNPIPSSQESLRSIAKLALYARFTYEIDETMRAKDKELGEKESQIRDLERKVAAMQTIVDAAKEAIAGLSTGDGKPVQLNTGQGGGNAVDAMVSIFATLVGGVAAQQFNFDVLTGCVGALLAATVVLQLLRRR